MGKFGQERYTPLQVDISASDAQVGVAKEDERLRTRAEDQQQHYRHMNSRNEDIEVVDDGCCCFTTLVAIFCCMQVGRD
jgi:hypothetical protein